MTTLIRIRHWNFGDNATGAVSRMMIVMMIMLPAITATTYITVEVGISMKSDVDNND